MTEEHTQVALDRGWDLIDRNHELFKARGRIAELEEELRKAKAAVECRFEARSDPNYPGNSSIAPAVAFCTVHNSYGCRPTTATKGNSHGHETQAQAYDEAR